MPSTDRRVITARYVFPVVGPPLEHARITIADGRIAALEPATRGPVDLDLGDVAILPALVNAHSHLEFSDLAVPLGTPGMPLPEWIAAVVAQRRAAAETLDSHAAVARGAQEALATGTGLVGEIGTAAWATGGISIDPLAATIFHEALGLADHLWPDRTEAIRTLVTRPATDQWQHGISPHAPYSTHPSLVEALVQLAAQRQLPVAMHLAESREELEFLRTGSGPFRQLLEDLGAWQAGAIEPNRRPLDYLQLLRPASPALVIHGNYLAADEIAFLAEHRPTMSLVYCPRTHAYFQHAPYPLAELLAAGVRVAVGTDSRASNPDLDLLAELRQAAHRHPDVSPAEILRLGTHSAATALGRAKTHGTLQVGRPAHLTIVPIAGRPADDPHELLWEQDPSASGLMLAGRWWVTPPPT